MTGTPDQHTTGPGYRPLDARPAGYLDRDAAALHRAMRPNYFGWLDHVKAAAGCSHPIRLAGEVHTIEPDTGRLLSSVHTRDLPDGVIYKPCGNRRRTVCPSCSQTYQGDAYQLIRTGLTGGKGIPDTVAAHPAVFVTLTAPGFGPVHTRRTSATGKPLPCRPRQTRELCPHGVDLRCHRLHTDTDPALGVPLCLDCYDYPGQVVWNHGAPELWRRTRIAIERHLRRTARARGVPGNRVRLRYAKVAEMQRRGVVHFHIVIRLDGHDPDDPEAVLPPPAGLDVHDLDHAVTTAATLTGYTTDGHPTNPAGWPMVWGEQVDVRHIRLSADGEMNDGMAAGYLAKYATKSTEATGHVSRRLDSDVIDLYANPHGSHPERLIDACWTLGGHHDWQGLRRWAHMLGFGGHFLTKARRYSLTFQILRDRRVIWRRTHHTPDQPTTQDSDQSTTLVVGYLNFVGSGWHTTGDALLANTAAALARERHQIAREELACLAS